MQIIRNAKKYEELLINTEILINTDKYQEIQRHTDKY